MQELGSVELISKKNVKKTQRNSIGDKLRKVVISASFLLQFLTKVTMEYKAVLLNKGFGFDPISRQWFDGKKPVDSSVPHIFLIRAFKSCGYADAGSRAESAIFDAETSPDLTFTAFKKRFLRRDYGARVRGIDIFLAWGKMVGIEIDTANLLLWCRKHPFVLHRFYAVAERAGIRIKNCARIWGLKGVFRHVFVGWRLVVKRADRGGRRSLRTGPRHDISGPTVAYGPVLPRVSGT